MSLFVWVMVGVAFWHFSVLVPDRFYGGVIGALVAAVVGALVSGHLLPSPGIAGTRHRTPLRRRPHSQERFVTACRSIFEMGADAHRQRSCKE
jgi:uncharacterized membrane protein YeaQ/YmgE (transglycosylase-associated protein family)